MSVARVSRMERKTGWPAADVGQAAGPQPPTLTWHGQSVHVLHINGYGAKGCAQDFSVRTTSLSSFVA